MRQVLQLLVLLLTTLPCSAQKAPFVHIPAERLPDLNIPRAGHQTLVVDGEVMVVGGHTDGFVPTATAEFLSSGAEEWRTQETVYTHDFGTGLSLTSGQVLLFGGAAEPLGIGQTFTVERYAPAERTFEGFGCLDIKRMYASAAELPDGDVVISGNWYQRDGVEVLGSHLYSAAAKGVQCARARPYILPTSDGDAIIFGALNSKGSLHDSDSIALVDRLHGQPYEVPLLREWWSLPLLDDPTSAAECFVGTTPSGANAYLLPLINRSGDWRIALVCDTAITLLPDLGPLPRRGPEGQAINYFPTLTVDHDAHRAYIVGRDSVPPHDHPHTQLDVSGRLYVYCFDCTYVCELFDSCQTVHEPIFFYTDTLEGVGWVKPVLTPEGDLVLVGGTACNNFDPSAAAYRLCIGRRGAQVAGCGVWAWIAWLAGGAVTLLLLLGGVVQMLRGTRKAKAIAATNPREPREPRTPRDPSYPRSPRDPRNPRDSRTPTDPRNPRYPRNPSDLEESSSPLSPSEASPALMQRICALMDEQRPYLREDLKLSDVADALGVHRNYISDCINSQQGCTFPQFVAGYRVRHAQQLLREQPHQKLSSVAAQSGFSNETTFFRAFKAVVGTTPREWMAQAS